ncbi:ABC-2 type transport system permease protein [Lentzea albidocapillata subsp. violacea]|uniref:ABC-2 type transport system permease protein n=1 Tax=Lentzea albidocapillata subsp. violacea TaxID=128104 RepID=A0A1G8S646_9PSEU|nr:ABC transporter permease [Lentzea albidocapillata]SDJ24714.1 ABC-2 type transport system permease protein [Lentzea albidocapillata subsp. violacea]
MRAVAVGQAELKLFWRNRTALFNSLLLPLLLAPVLYSVDADGVPLVVGLIGFALLMAVYYNLVTTFVARREELVLKRLRVGELTDPEILAGAALPSVVVALGQMVLYTVVVGVITGVALPARPWFLLLGVLGGVAVFVLLAAASSAFTRTVEMAQVTSLPVLMACMLGSGLIFPLSVLPGGIASVLKYLPLTPVLELLRAGWADGPVLQPLIVLAVWIVLGTYAVQRWFRWDPRR